MEVTKDIWNEETINYIVEAIKQADHIAIDNELTGIDIKNKHYLDTVEERILKYSQCTNRYSIMQFGICTFKAKDKKNIETKPFNIYLFPDDNGDDKKISLELSAIIFNRNHNFDFSKWIYQGLPFLNDLEVERESKYWAEKHINNFKANSPISINSEENKIKFREIMNQIDTLLNDSDKENLVIDRPPNFVLFSVLEELDKSKKEKLYFSEEMKLVECNSQVISLENNTTTNNDNKDLDSIGLKEIITEVKVITITKIKNKEHLEELRSHYINHKVPLIIKQKKGAKILFDALVDNKKKLIGHNCILDFMFLYTHFKRDFPTSLRDIPKEVQLQYSNNKDSVLLSYFKDKFKNTFAETYDTKYLMLNFVKDDKVDITKSHLEYVYLYMKTRNENGNNKINFALSHKNSKDNKYEDSNHQAFHDAAYDAFTTGCLFYYILTEKGTSWVEKFKNQFFLMYCVYNNLDIHGNNEEMEYKDYLFLGILMNEGISLSSMNLNELYKLMNNDKKNNKTFKEMPSNSLFLFIKKDDDNTVFEDYKKKLNDVIEKLKYSELTLKQNNNNNNNNKTTDAKGPHFTVIRDFEEMKKQIKAASEKRKDIKKISN